MMRSLCDIVYVHLYAGNLPEVAKSVHSDVLLRMPARKTLLLGMYIFPHNRIDMDEMKGSTHMGIQARWANDEYRAVIISIVHPWKWEEYDRIVDELIIMMGTVDHPCATIVDTSNMGALPKGSPIAHMKRFEQMRPKNQFAGVMVGAPYSARIFLDIMVKLRPAAANLRLYANSIEDAHKMIDRLYAEQFEAS